MGNALTIADVLKQKEQGGFKRVGNVPISTHILVPPQTAVGEKESKKIIEKATDTAEPKEKKEKQWKGSKSKKNDTEHVKEEK